MMNKKQVKFAKLCDAIIQKPQVLAFRHNFPNRFRKLWNSIQDGTRQRARSVTAQVVFDYLYPDWSKLCYCGKSVRWANELGRYRLYCSIQCQGKAPSTIAKRKATTKERYGHEDANKNPEIQAKKIATFQKNFGVDNPSQSDKIKKRKTKTMRRNYGVDHWSKTKKARSEFAAHNPMHSKKVRKKLAKTNKKRYGTKCVFSSNYFQKKSRKTCLKKYGVENAGAICHGFRRRKVIDKFGNIHSVQGFEPLAITWLSSKRKVKNIVSAARKIPKIKFQGRNYTPDLLVEWKGLKLIEVKGSWPLRNTLETVAAKCRAATEYMNSIGGEFWFYFFTDNHKLIRLQSPTIEQLSNLLSECRLRK